MQPETFSVTPSNDPQTHPQQPIGMPQDSSNPGKRLGVLGLVLTVIGIGIVGVVLAIVGLVKSKRAGFRNIPAWIAIGLNIFFLVVVLPITLFLFLVANSNSSQSALPSGSYAEDTVDLVNRVYDKTGKYPTSLSEFRKSAGDQLDEKIIFANHELTAAPANPSTVAFYVCRQGEQSGITVKYWDTVNNRVDYFYSADYSESELGENKKPVCTLSSD